MIDPVEALQGAADEVKDRAKEWIGEYNRQTTIEVTITVAPSCLTSIAVKKEYNSRYDVNKLMRGD